MKIVLTGGGSAGHFYPLIAIAEALNKKIEKENVDNLKGILGTESLKITRNSKGWTWEIKILEINTKRIEEIDEDMNMRFGRNGEE